MEGLTTASPPEGQHASGSPECAKDQHGNREQFDFTSARYRELVSRIMTELAERFGHDPNVIG
jgi:beta-galactosidase